MRTDHVPGPRVVAGYDGRWQDLELLRRAAREAERLGLPLTVITVLRRRNSSPLDHRAARPDSSQSAIAAWRRLSYAANELRRSFPVLRIRAFSMDEADVSADRYPMKSAALLVLGSKGRFQEPALQPGSISDVLQRAAGCPVLIVDQDEDADGRRTASGF